MKDKKVVNFSVFLKEEIEKVEGVYYPVRASFPRRLLIKQAGCMKLHPNTEDEFCFPEIGPNYSIISRYRQEYKSDVHLLPGYDGGSVLEPLIVQKAMPDGYLILNGHHRWAAAILSGMRSVRIKIVNLTQETDIRKMLESSRSDRRVTLDLDEVVFCTEADSFAERPLRFPLNRFFRERVRKGIPALLHFFNEHNYDIWVYTSSYCSVEYIRYFFKHWNVRLTGIITGTARKGGRAADTAREMKKLVETQYRSTIHIDNQALIRTFSGSKKCEEYPLNGAPDTWAREVMEIVRKLRPEAPESGTV